MKYNKKEAPRTMKRWSNEEILYIQSSMKKPVKTVVDKLGRSEASIYTARTGVKNGTLTVSGTRPNKKARKNAKRTFNPVLNPLSKTRKRMWSNEEIIFFKENMSMSDSDLAERFKRTTDSILNMKSLIKSGKIDVADSRPATAKEVKFDGVVKKDKRKYTKKVKEQVIPWQPNYREDVKRKYTKTADYLEKRGDGVPKNFTIQRPKDGSPITINIHIQ